MTASPLAMSIRVLHRWRQRMSGVELSILLVGSAVLLFLLGPYGHREHDALLPAQIHLPFLQAVASTVWHSLLGLALVGAVALGLAGLAGWSSLFRRVLVPSLSVLRAMPGLVLTGLFAAFLPSLGVIVAVSAFNMLWRVLTALLDAEDIVPDALEEVAAGMHMTGWQRFWRLQMPVAIPLVVFRASQAMPGFWFRLFCVEGLMVLLSPETATGCGALAVMGLEAHRSAPLLVGCLGVLGLVYLVDQCLVHPMTGWARRYRMDGAENAGAQVRPRVLGSWMLVFWRRMVPLTTVTVRLHRMAGSVGNWKIGRVRKFRRACSGGTASGVVPGWVWPLGSLILFAGAVWKARLVDRLPIDILESVLTLSHVCGALVLSGLLWLPLAYGLFEVKSRGWKWVRAVVMIGMLFPVVVVYPLFRGIEIIPTALMLFLGAHWWIGGAVLDGMQAIPSSFRQVARGLGLNGGLLWKRLILPAVAPEFCGGLLLAAIPLWDAVMVAEIFVPSDTGLGATLFSEMLYGRPAPQVLLVMLLTLSSLLLDRLILQPIAVHAAQKYAIR